VETLQRAAVATHRTLFNTHNPVVVASLNMLYVKQIQQLIMHLPHHHSLVNVVTTAQQPGTSTRRSFCGTENTFFHIGAPANLWPTIICHNGGHIGPVYRKQHSREMNILPFGFHHYGYLSAYRHAVDALLWSASLYSSIICQSVE
jgi:hypothetical protein